ncbi:F-box protein ETP2 isoform X2 [Capsella rubella]|uniref:F-box protein ETP2 isoform X2 n=1 Tax=Capsella rubella TaxID=81985 RepID=UPI000CD5B095|nr:F-box protein ETP2 isoform X2 [Capsella rubella]
MTMTIPELLPKDLVEEILCRVPATSLKRLRATCKAWNRLFKDDRRFARKHFELKSELNVSDSKKSEARFDITRVIHCDGLLLCSSEFDESRVLVLNPLIGETRWIRTRDFHKDGRSFDLGYSYQDDRKSCNKKSYKILSYYRGTKYFEIYDLTSNSWKSLDDMIVPGRSTGFSELSVSLKGNTYWFVRDVTKTPRTISLLKFDFTTEETVYVPLPYQTRRFESTSLSVVGEEKLSVLLQRDQSSKTEIWVTNRMDETTEVVSWSKVLALDLNPDLKLWNDASFLLGEEKKVVMSCEKLSNDEVEVDKIRDMIYIVGEDNVVTEVEIGATEIDGCRPVLLNYVPSLVQI